MKCLNFKLATVLLLIFSCCLLSSCTDELEDDDAIQCVNQTRLINLSGDYVGTLRGIPNFSMRLTPSNQECVKVGFFNQQGWISSFDGEIADDRILLDDEYEQSQERDHCNSYGEIKTVIVATTGTILIHDDNDSIELEFNDVKQIHSDKSNGEVLCIREFSGSLMKQ